MIIIFIIFILIFIIFSSAYISTLNKKKNIEGFADLLNPSGMMTSLTDKPSESDKLIVLNEIFNNVINHETALNIYDPTYIVDNTISIQNVDPKSTTSSIFKNCMNLIPFLQKHDIEILQLTKNGYIQSKTLTALLDISGCDFTLDSLKQSVFSIINDIENKYAKIQENYDVYYTKRNENRNVDNLDDLYRYRLGKYSIFYPLQYDYELLEIFNTYGGINRNVIDLMMNVKLDITKSDIFNNSGNSIALLANDLDRLINNDKYINKTQLNNMGTMRNTGNLLDGSQVAYFDTTSDNGASKQVYTEMQKLSAQTIINSAANNPPLTNSQALGKIEAVILFYIMKVVEYQDLEMQNISQNALNTFKKIYSIIS